MALISYKTGLRIYEQVPDSVKDVLRLAIRPIPRQKMLGKGFMEHLAFLRSSDRWSAQELERYQLKHMRHIIDHAYRNVPFYHNLFTKEKLHPVDIEGPRSLSGLPVLTKDIIRAEKERLTAIDKDTYLPGEAYTTGSTGRPLHFLLDQQTREIVLASVWRHYLNSGVTDLNARIATFRGDFVSQRGPEQLWKWNGPLKELNFNTYCLNKENVRRMVSKLDRFKPEIIRGYPHALYIMSKEMKGAKMDLKFTPRFIHTSSEQLPQYMREAIEQTFGTKVVDWYGQSENIISAGECSGGHYHQEMETGILNIGEDAWGLEKVIGTTLWNYSMPFINYDVGDHVTVEDTDCSCERHHLVISSIEGRVSDIVVTEDGRAFSGVGIDNFYEKEVLPQLTSAPEFMRLVQEDVVHFTVEVFKQGGLAAGDEGKVQGLFAELFGRSSMVVVRQLDQYPDQKKWKNIESKLPAATIDSLLKA